MIVRLEVSEQIRSGKYERNPQRGTQRNDYGEQLWRTRLGENPVGIVKLRSGSQFPSLLEPWCHLEKALAAPIEQAVSKCVSVVEVDEIVYSAQEQTPAAGAAAAGASWL